MTSINVPFSEDGLDKLRALAERNGVAPEELARQVLEEFLARPPEDFAAAAKFVFWKNADLYKRLA